MPSEPLPPRQPRVALTAKQRDVLDYMRGNGCVLTVEGWRHLTGRRLYSNRGLSQALSALVDKGLVSHAAPPAPMPRHRLTEAGKRA